MFAKRVRMRKLYQIKLLGTNRYKSWFMVQIGYKKKNLYRNEIGTKIQRYKSKFAFWESLIFVPSQLYRF